MPTRDKEICICGTSALVPLSMGLFAVLDAEDVQLVEGYTWHAFRHGRTFYARTNVKSRGQGYTSLRMHRLLSGVKGDEIIDHIDGDGLNNRRSNLREASRQDNAMNRALSVNNTSGFKGVWWSKSQGAWAASIRAHKVRHHLGYHATPEAAHAAYCEASARLHGEFGRTA